MESNGAGLEQRLSSLQAQIDDLRQAAADDVLPLERRLTTLTDHTDGILKRWAATADRHARAVSQLESHLHELGDAGTRLQHDATRRLQDLERIVQQEWSALRDLHETPVRQLVEQAATLTEVCIATANSAQHGFDRADARLATIENDFQRTTRELTREVQTLLAEVRQLSATSSRQLAGDAPAWPLEGVTRLHRQLRESTAEPLALPAAVVNTEEALPSELPPVVEIERTSPRLERAPVETVQEPARRESRTRPVIAAGVAILVVAGGLFAWRLERDVSVAAERADQLQAQARVAEQASRQAAERQEAADRQLVAARDLASKAQTIGDVLAAPDLVRYTLTNPVSLPGVSGQVLWSRSRGFVFSASGLPAPPAEATYQIWLLTRGGAVSAATFVPDTAGRVTVTTAPAVARPVFGAIVTTEPKGGASTPSGEPVLARLPAVPAQS